jgi:hypothetical protein
MRLNCFESEWKGHKGVEVVELAVTNCLANQLCTIEKIHHAKRVQL